MIRDLGLFFILAHTLAFSFSCRFYYDSRSQRSQWDHPLDGVYKDKVKAARQAAARKPRVLGDVTNSKARRGGESQRGKKAGGGERKKKNQKLLPPLRLVPLDVSNAPTEPVDATDLSQQNPLYLEGAVVSGRGASDSESGVSTSATTTSLSGGTSASTSTGGAMARRKALRQQRRRNKGGRQKSPREARLREVAETSGSSSATEPGPAPSSTWSKSRSGSRGARVLAPLGDPQHSPVSSSSGDSTLLSPRTPECGRKKKGSPRRIEKTNGWEKVSQLGGQGSNAGARGVDDAGNMVDPVQLKLVIDVDEEERATRGDIDELKRTQSEALEAMGRQVGETIERCVVAVGDKLLREGGQAGRARAGRSQEGSGQEVLTADAGQAQMLKQLKGEIDLMSDLMAKEGSAKALLVSQIDKFKNSLDQERVKSRELQDKLEATRREGKEERAELKESLQEEKQEVEKLISRVSELSREKFQMAENFNSTVVDQRDEILRQLGKLWARVKDLNPATSTVAAAPTALEPLESGKNLAKELEVLSVHLKEELVRGNDRISEVLGSSSDQTERVLGEIQRVAQGLENSALGAIKESDLAALQRNITEGFSEMLESNQKQIESIYTVKMDAISSRILEGLSDVTGRMDGRSSEQIEAFCKAAESCERILSEQGNNHQVLCKKLTDISNRVDAVEGLMPKAYLKKEDLEEEVRYAFDKLTKAVAQQQDAISKSLEEGLQKHEGVEKIVLSSEGCQTEEVKLMATVGGTPGPNREDSLDDDDAGSTFSLSDCATHSKKQIALLKQSVHKAKANRKAIKLMESMRNTTSNSMMHGLEAYINGLQASSKLTKGIYARLNRAQEV